VNLINYARGYLDELDMSVRAGFKERAAAAKAELSVLVDDLRLFEVAHFGPEDEALKASVIADVEAAVKTTRKTSTK
jgi:hypothetical protein